MVGLVIWVDYPCEGQIVNGCGKDEQLEDFVPFFLSEVDRPHHLLIGLGSGIVLLSIKPNASRSLVLVPF